ncbi:phosphotransferase family protein [Methylobacterium sp. NEAU 140]|uniref:phosphotransferase family protein n=1 Tax=Methylobacterium sp. NEAU 140 TaxID=3064945 RepID=UPI002734EFA3|nr:phosphotransferase family protein [Methylobacterium sp. NEAU 140]MDP4027088.1 phosphotransferase family protein [Methylobacterium sp. NEAU 140]
MSAGATFTGVKPVEPRHRIDEARLAAWLGEHVPGFAGPLAVMQFRGGQSNPTYRLETPGGAYVLRRKPSGTLLPSAHAVEREFRVIAALYAEGFPVPRPYALCEDGAVIGAAFYVMEAVDGQVHWDGALPGLSPHARHRHYAAMIATLARLHAIDPEAAGLGDYGRPGNYFARQVDRWTRQYRAAEDGRLEDVERLIAWLPRTVPEQGGVAVVHGDYRLDNLIFSDDGSVSAVLDWELSTLGDPLADFSYLLMQWALPADGRSGLGGLDLADLGIPGRDEAVALYCRAAGRESVPDLDWYFAYNLFRLTGILQGVAARARAGNAASEHAAAMAARVPALAAAAWGFAERAGA